MAKKTSPAEDNLPVAATYADFDGMGFENQTREDITVPFIKVLQGLSPELDTIAGAKPGKLINSVTNELADSLMFVPATTSHVYVEWVPRTQGGGFVAVHELHSPTVASAKATAEGFNTLKTERGNDLIETFYMFGVLCDERQPLGMAVLAFTSTKIRVYKRFNTRLQTFTLVQPDGRKVRPPLFAYLCKVGTTKEKNAKGDFYNFVLDPAGHDLPSSLLAPTDPRFAMAAECKRLVDSGRAVAAHEVAEDGEDRTPF